MSFSATDALTVDGRRLVLQTPRGFFAKRAAALGLLVPVLLTVIVGLVALLETVEGAGPGAATLVVAAVCALVGLGSGLAGAFTLVRAGPRSDASRVVIDLEAATLDSARDGRVPLSAVQGLVLHQPNRLTKWHCISATLAAGPRAEDGDPYRPPASGRVALVGHLTEWELTQARALLATLGDHLGVPTTDDSGGIFGKGSGKGGTAHALAYLPVQGIFLVASLFLLLARRGEPLSQFHARQSLAFLPVELVALFGTTLVTAPLLFVTDEPHPVAGVVMGLAIGTVAIGRLVLRFVAAWKAHKGEAWVIPGMGWLVRRWLPPAG